MPDGKTVCALILAAGLSRRMGEFKPLLPLGGATVIENTVASALAGRAERAVVVTGYRGGEVESVLRHRFGDVVRFVRNPDYAATDMLRSAQIGVEVLPACEAFFLLPGDMPAVSRETFRKLLEVRKQGRPLLAFPTLNGYRKHPPLVDARLIPEILAFHGEGGLRELWSRFEDDTVTVPVEDGGVWLDLDTPEDYWNCKQVFDRIKEV